MPQLTHCGDAEYASLWAKSLIDTRSSKLATLLCIQNHGTGHDS
jgi:hypothetical protein